MRFVGSLALCLSCVLGSTVAAQLRGETIVRGLTNPIAVVPLPDDPELYLIAEQRGLIRVARSNVLLEQPFLDLRGEVRAGVKYAVRSDLMYRRR